MYTRLKLRDLQYTTASPSVEELDRTGTLFVDPTTATTTTVG